MDIFWLGIMVFLIIFYSEIYIRARFLARRHFGYYFKQNRFFVAIAIYTLIGGRDLWKAYLGFAPSSCSGNI